MSFHKIMWYIIVVFESYRPVSVKQRPRKKKKKKKKKKRWLKKFVFHLITKY